MQPREKKLAAIVGVLLAVMVLYLGVGRIVSSFSERTSRLKALKAEIHEKTGKEARGQKAAEQLAEWESRSLPSNHELARTLYQNWLVQLADKGKLKNVSVDAGRGGSHRGIYYKLPFTVHARGSLEQAIRFMHEFYAANHLQQLREVSLQPIEKSSDLDMNFIIEALILPKSSNTELNPEPAVRLAYTGLADYTSPITKRNFFAEYVEPRPPEPPRITQPPPPPPQFDPSKYAYLTAILEVEGATEAWFDVRTTGELLRLVEGQKLEIGKFKGTISRINLNDVEIESDGKFKQLALGKSLTQATAMPARPKVETPVSTVNPPESDGEAEKPADETAAKPAEKPVEKPADEAVGESSARPASTGSGTPEPNAKSPEKPAAGPAPSAGD
jgi:Tfp pilus assembly protein PilO